MGNGAETAKVSNGAKFPTEHNFLSLQWIQVSNRAQSPLSAMEPSIQRITVLLACNGAQTAGLTALSQRKSLMEPSL